MTRPDPEAGFTLVEMLVAAGMSTILLLVLVAMLTTTVNQAQRTNAQVSATRQARNALAVIENELHSACIGGTAAPIQAGSNGTDLDFLTYNGTSDAVGTTQSTMPVWHDLSFANGTLTDNTYSTSAAASGGFTQGSLIGSVQMLSNVSALGTNPVFQYFAYQAYGPASDGNYYWTIPDGTNPQPVTGAKLTANPLGVPLSSTNANNAVEVVINVTVNTSQYSQSRYGVPDPVTDSISLRLTPPPNYSSTASDTADFGPCQ